MGFVRSRCPKCGSIMMNDCCVGCGFMTNGNYTGKVDSNDKYSDLKLYDSHYDDLIMNRKLWLIFLLESFYFCYRGHLLFGLFISLIDFLISSFAFSFLNYLFGLFIPSLVGFSIIGFIFIKRIVYVMFGNAVCLKLDMKRIDRLKSKYSNYQGILCNHNDSNWFYVALGFIFYFVVCFIVLVYKWKINGYL